MSANNSLAELKAAGVQFVRVSWIDLINFTRYRVLPIGQFEKLIANDGSISIAKVAIGLPFLDMPEGFTATGEYFYKPDLSTLRLAPYAEGHATVLGWFREKEPVKGLDGVLTDEVAACPRGLLRRVVQSAKEKSGIDFLVGFETEFMLLKSTNPVEAVNEKEAYGYSTSTSLPAGSVAAKVLDEISHSLAKANIELLMYHAEAGPGQFEVVTGPLPPLEAADALVLTREIISNTASKYGLRATLSPRVYPRSCGNGAHVHISLKSSNPSPPADVDGAPGLTQLEASWLQSVVNHLPAALAFTLPTPASYDRVVDGIWTGGTYAAWGKDNRECPVRLCGAPGNWHFEVKTNDGTSNPHIALAALLSGGMIGAREGIKLEAKNTTEKPGSLTDEQRAALGITKRLPLKLEQARENLLADKALRAELGEEFITTFLSVNRTLAAALEKGNAEENRILMVQNY